MLEYLRGHEKATSTTLAKHLGESTGQTSYHLRQAWKTAQRHVEVAEQPRRDDQPTEAMISVIRSRKTSTWASS